MGASAAMADVTYIGRAVVPGGPNAAIADFSGLPHTLLEDGKTYQDRFDGFGSGLAFTGYANRFVMLNDRGPNKNPNLVDSTVDNTTSYLNRFQIVDITLSGSGNNYSVNLKPQDTSMLKNEAGQNYIGLSSQFTSNDATQNRRLDPEGVAVAPDGTVYISDEYGPTIYHFTQTGHLLGNVAAPAKFLASNVSKTVAAEIAGNTSGRVGNKGMEGLTISPDGKTMIGAMQSPLLQDAPVSGVNSTGTNIRFLKYDLTNPLSTPKELVYQLDNANNLVSEITPLNDHQFLVDERDAVGGTTGGVKKLYMIDLNQTNAPTNVAGIGSLSTTGNTPGVTALAKTQFADIASLLRASPTALDGGKLPDKFEGYSFGPDLPDGRHTLLVTNDNDYADPTLATSYNNYVFAFAVDSAFLQSIGVTDFRTVSLGNGTFVPEPTSLTMVGLGGLLLTRRAGRVRLSADRQ